MSSSYQLKRGTRDGIDRQAALSKLLVGEALMLQDEERLALATSATSYVTFAKSQELGDIVDDNILSPPEKPAVVQEYNTIVAEQSSIDVRASNNGITAEKVTYDDAVTALAAYLGTLPGWNTVPGVGVVIDGNTFRSKFKDVYTAREALLAKISEAQAAAFAIDTVGIAVSYVGEFAAHPTPVDLGVEWKQNAVYRNTLDAKSYILAGDPLAWEVFLVDGTSFDLVIESSNGNIFRVGDGRSTTLTARIFKNGVEVTADIPSTSFQWFRSSSLPKPAPNDDGTWNATHNAGYKSIVVDIDDVNARATFTCQINL